MPAREQITTPNLPMHDHDRGDQRPTDRRIDTSDEPDHNQDQVWFECACCGTRYRSRRTAMQCCAGCFDDPDHDPRSPPVAMADGGHSAGVIERELKNEAVEDTSDALRVLEGDLNVFAEKADAEYVLVRLEPLTKDQHEANEALRRLVSQHPTDAETDRSEGGGGA